MDIALQLECYHAIFSKLWHMGKPVFTQEISTAAIKFNKNGDFLEFVFNYDFWKSLDANNKLFVICHEAMHVILNHGHRSKDSKNKNAANVAMDIVVNHLLVDKFGFIREKILNHQQYCWIDTIFKNKKSKINSDESYEYYYNNFEKKYGDGMPGDGTTEPKLVDNHDYLNSTQEDGLQKQIYEKFLQEMSEEESKCIKELLKESNEAGRSLGSWFDISLKNKKTKKKWETVIKKWELLDKNYDSIKDVEQWAMINRRMTSLSEGMFLPSNQEVIEFEFENKKIDVLFFIDTSGSCISYKDRFFDSAMSLDKNKFQVRIFSFDTAVEEFDLKNKNSFYGGGGTSFVILENYIYNMIETKQITKYPNAVFVITDGYACDVIKPKYPKKWHWFLTEYSSESCIDKNCNIFKLNNYE